MQCFHKNHMIFSSILFFRLTAIDIKYQIWKFGVVFTDNVSLHLQYFLKSQTLQNKVHVKCTKVFFIYRLSSTWFGTWLCHFLDITTISSLLVTCWTSQWVSRPCVQFFPRSHTMENRYSRFKNSNCFWKSVLTVGIFFIWSPADFVRLPTDKEMISL